MTENPDVDHLIELGLRRYEAKAYLALIGRSDASASEIAELSGLPRQRVYDVMTSLTERGLATVIPAAGENRRGMRYRAQPPDQVTERLLALRQLELDRVATSAQGLSTRLLSLYESGMEKDGPLDYVEVIKDRDLAVQAVQRLWDEAEHEMLTFNAPPYLATPRPEDVHVPQVHRVRGLYQLDLLTDPSIPPVLQRFAELGEEVRLVQTVPMKMTVVDGVAAAFNMPDPVGGRRSVTTLVVRHPALAGTLRLAFEAVWSQGRSLSEALS